MRKPIFDTYGKLPLAKYLAVQQILRKDLEPLEEQVALIAAINDMGEDAVLALPLAEYTTFAAALDFLTKPLPQAKPRLPKEYICGDLVLVPVRSFDKMCAAQYIDFQTFSKGGDETLAKTLSCFLVPKGKEYNEGYDITEVWKAIEQMPITLVSEMLAFFCRAGQTFCKLSCSAWAFK